MANRLAMGLRRHDVACKWFGSGPSRLTRIGVGAAIAAVVLGCGARAMVEGAADEDDVVFGTGGSGGSGASGDSGGRPSGGAAQAPVEPGPIDFDGVRLPDCEPGFLPSRAGSRECTYVFQGNCYEEALMACACACQGLSDNNCIIDGFLDPDEPQRVSCVAR